MSIAHQSGPRRTARGFTLIELLVVITIIAILLGILFPVMAAVRNSGKSVLTKSTMRNVLQAVDQFVIDNRRSPGHYSAKVMGHSGNENRGFTAMENALVELAGGVVDNSNAPAADNTYITIQPWTGANLDEITIDTTLMGSSAGPGYLTLKAADFYPVFGQVTDVVEEDQAIDIDGNGKGIPDVVDAFGQPILMWTQHKSPSSVEDFALMESNSDNASFYWMSNSGYLSSESLGKDSVNQSKRSSLGLINEEEDIQDSLEGVLGSRSNPTVRSDASEGWDPAIARGKVIVISAGEDGVFFEKADEDVSERIWYLPDGEYAPSDEAASARTPDDFDDVILSTSGG